jgi:hypothetical protein
MQSLPATVFAESGYVGADCRSVDRSGQSADSGADYETGSRDQPTFELPIRSRDGLAEAAVRPFSSLLEDLEPVS